LNYWNYIYEHFNPIAFDLGFISVHWYGIMYISALLVALWYAKWIIKKDSIAISHEEIDNYFIWIEVGIILGARIWYILFYDTNTSYYLIHPWQIFNPFHNGEFVGIRGMSYHGAVVGAIIGSWLFHRKNPNKLSKIVDIVALAIPVGYIFGRIGNFLNQELVGRATDEPWGILVDGVLRHPSQLYEAFLEGFIIAIILFAYRKYKKFDGELLLVYGASYGIFRAIAEIFRAPDAQIGYICCDFVTLGIILSLSMTALSAILWIYFYKRLKA